MVSQAGNWFRLVPTGSGSQWACSPVTGSPPRGGTSQELSKRYDACPTIAGISPDRVSA